jgi:regulator of sigma E protease
MQSLLAFLVALGLLVAVHEYGHYKVAVLCGVRVLRFSLGFGPVLYKRSFGAAFAAPSSSADHARASKAEPERSEFVLSAIPLGGYVTFWDEAHVRESGLTEPLSEDERDALFESQSLFNKSAIVMAGPLANLLLCVLLTWVMYLWGVEQTAPVLASPVPASVAEHLGFEAGERVLSWSLAGEKPQAISSLEDFEARVEQARRDHLDAVVWLSKSKTPGVKDRLELPWSLEDVPASFDALGFQGPYREAVIQGVSAASPGDLAGLKPLDRVLSVDGVAVSDAADLRSRIAQSLAAGRVQPMVWHIERRVSTESSESGQRDRAGRSESTRQTLDVVVQAVAHEVRPGVMSPRVGIDLGAMPARVTVRYGPWSAWVRALHTSGEWIAQTLHALGQLFASSESWSNLGGPLTLATYAGQSAGLGLSAFLAYLGLVSVNLGVFNLLPIPVLDGGHLLAYAWQALTGRAMGAALWGKIQRVGLVAMLLLTLLALRNDLARVWGG